MAGIGKLEDVKIVTFGPGEAHLQNKMNLTECYICHKPNNEDMVLMWTSEKEMSMVCPDHAGVIQEFIRQFKRPPLGWT